MQIAVIGTGSVGSALGRGWSEAGHTVVFGTRSPDDADVRSLARAARATLAAPAAAAAGAEVVVLAVPGDAAAETAAALGDLSGKVVVDPTNPIAPGLRHALPAGTSNAERIAERASGAAVVKAFNTTGAENLRDGRYPDGRLAMFVCGDDADAKARVVRLAEDLGFEGVDAGPLATARHLEELALLWITLAARGDRGFGIALLRR